MNFLVAKGPFWCHVSCFCEVVFFYLVWWKCLQWKGHDLLVFCRISESAPQKRELAPCRLLRRWPDPSKQAIGSGPERSKTLASVSSGHCQGPHVRLGPDGWLQTVASVELGEPRIGDGRRNESFAPNPGWLAYKRPSTKCFFRPCSRNPRSCSESRHDSATLWNIEYKMCSNQIEDTVSFFRRHSQS